MITPDKQDSPAAPRTAEPEDASQAMPSARLVSTTPGSDLCIELQPGLNRIGRQREENHIVLVSPQISRCHAEIDVFEAGLRLRDLGSGNGTYVNGQRIAERMLKPGDLIAFSDKFTFRVLMEQRAPATQTRLGKRAKSIPIPSAEESGPPDTDPSIPPGSGPEDPPQPTREPQPTAPASVPIRARAPDGDRPGSQSLPPTLVDEEPENAVRAAQLNRDKHRLIELHEATKRALAAQSLAEIDAVLIEALERTAPFDRAFATYRLPSAEWKLVISPKGDRWESQTVRDLLQLALRGSRPILVLDSRADPRLGSREDGLSDQRLLVPLKAYDRAVGTLFLISRQPNAYDDETVLFLSMFADIAALVIVNRARQEGHENVGA